MHWSCWIQDPSCCWTRILLLAILYGWTVVGAVVHAPRGCSSRLERCWVMPHLHWDHSSRCARSMECCCCGHLWTESYDLFSLYASFVINLPHAVTMSPKVVMFRCMNISRNNFHWLGCMVMLALIGSWALKSSLYRWSQADPPPSSFMLALQQFRWRTVHQVSVTPLILVSSVDIILSP